MNREPRSPLPLYELPEGWIWSKLGDLVANEPNSMRDGPFGSGIKTADYISSGVRVIRLGNIGVGKFNNSDKVFVSQEKYEILTKHEIFPGDLVIATLAEPVGRCCQIPKNACPAIVKADCVRYKSHKYIEPLFVMNWQNSPDGRRRSEHASHGIGRLRMNLGEMRSLDVPVPPLEEQRRIVAKLESLQERSRRARTALEAIPPLLEKLRQSVLAAAFRGDLTREWREQHPDVEPASVLLERIRKERRRRWEEAELAKMEAKGKTPKNDSWKKKYQEPEPVDVEGLPELPEGWCWARFDDAGTIQLGRRRAPEYVDEAIEKEYIRVANVKEDFLDRSDLNSMRWSLEDLEKLALLPGDILISEGQSLERIGQSASVPVWAEGLPFQSTLHRLRVSEGFVSSRYAQLVCLYCSKTGLFKKYASITTNIAHLTLSKLKQVPFPLCSLEEQQRLTENTDYFLAVCSNVKSIVNNQFQDLSKIDQSILSKAFRGELVPQDPNDEPASVLLERIRAERAAAEGGAKKAKKKGGRRGKKASTSRKSAPKRAKTTSESLENIVFRALLGLGVIGRDLAVGEVEGAIQERGEAAPDRAAIEAALGKAIERGRVEEPYVGQVRAVLREAREYGPEQWALCLEEAVGDELGAIDDEEAVRRAAAWAREHLGLEFKRIKKGGLIDQGIRAAIEGRPE